MHKMERKVILIGDIFQKLIGLYDANVKKCHGISNVKRGTKMARGSYRNSQDFDYYRINSFDLVLDY